MRLHLPVLVLIVAAGCAAPPPPVAAPSTPPPPPMQAEDRVEGTAQVNASALNVRRDPSTDADVLTQVRRGTVLSVLLAGESWTKVRLSNGTTGWVASRFIGPVGQRAAATSTRRGSCPPDSDYAFVETPTLAFSDSDAHGLVVVEATVNTSGNVTATRVLSNTTGDQTLALLAEREIKGAKFSPPIRSCVPRSFIFTYRRTF